jgi:hypothetical protein
MTEAMIELQRAYGLHNNINSEIGIKWDKWIKNNQNSNVVGECDQSHKAIFATTFANLENDPMSGLRTRGIGTDPHIVCVMNAENNHLVNGVASNRYFDFYFEFTKILTLGVNGIQVLD